MAKTLKDGKSTTLTIRCSGELKARIVALQEKFYPEMTLSEIAGMCAGIGEEIEQKVCSSRLTLIKDTVREQIDKGSSGKVDRKKTAGRSAGEVIREGSRGISVKKSDIGVDTVKKIQNDN